MTYQLVVARSAARALSSMLPEAVATAALGFMTGPLLENPRRVGKRLHAPLDDKWSARRGQYRIIYTVVEATRTVSVLQVSHRRDAHR